MSNAIHPSTPSPFTGLEPAIVWAHFATICNIPHGSKNETRLLNHLKQWAEQRQLTTLIDAAGNLYIRKPASRGCENAPGVILQAHLDMVCQKNSNTDHDFERDPIRPIVRDGALVALDTTLGADNGIGVALALAALEDTTLVHGTLEALLTVDEEDGMGGANGLPANLLQGKYLINLDTEAWGEFYLGCAGGMDVYVNRESLAEAVPTGWQCHRIDVCGLRGGHSGININEGRGNAIKLLTRILYSLQNRFPLRLSQFVGGTARNALPREAYAIIALQPESTSALYDALAEWNKTLRTELRGADDGVQVAIRPASADKVMPQIDHEIWLNSLHAAPHGVKRMSVSLPGVIETSNNLGMIDLKPSAGSCNFMTRSNLDTACEALADEIVSLWRLSGTTAKKAGYYPGWTPNTASPLLALCQQVYEKAFDAKAETQVIHAGLECGIIGAKYPNLDIISFGPTIHNPHAPGESVEIDTVAKSWQLLGAILKATASIK
ncbi:MAG: aminoacyl-histidine dipeptidase [Oxalobacter sp.]|nr:MAG: aminoacyl-histidine dipeptidase [Oxalobacter sp.]